MAKWPRTAAWLRLPAALRGASSGVRDANAILPGLLLLPLGGDPAAAVLLLPLHRCVC